VILYRNNGDGTFTDVSQKSGLRVEGWASSAGFFDYDNDGKTDIVSHGAIERDLCVFQK
jgi:enediyne biosynthesis protein E4